MEKKASRNRNIRFKGHAEPRIINAIPESLCLIEQQNTEPTKKRLPKKLTQKKNQAIVCYLSEKQSLKEITPALTSVFGVIAIPASQEKMPTAMVTNFKRIQEETIKVQTIEAALNEEKKFLVELKDLEKEIADQEQQWLEYFNTIRQEMARLTSK